MAQNDGDLGGYQVAQNQLLAIQQEQQQNLMAAQAASAQTGSVNQVAQQAAGLLTANQQAAINANVNPQTRGILQKYGVGKPQTVRNQSQRNVGQNVVINNNTTTNNYGGPVQGRELSFSNNNIAMKQQAEETNRFKAWLSSLFNKQSSENANRDREFNKRARSLEKQSDKLTKKLGSMGKGIVEGLSPKRIIGNMNDGLKRILMIFGLHLLASNWSKILEKVAEIESTVKGWIEYLGIGNMGKKASGFITDLRNLFMGKEAAKSGKSFLEYLKDMFIGDDKKSIWGYIKLYFEQKKNERVDALSKLKFPELKMSDLDNIPGAIFKIISFLGDVVSVSINGASGLAKAVKGNINRSALNHTYQYNQYKSQLYNSRTAGKYGIKGEWQTRNSLGKKITVDEDDIAAGDLSVINGDFNGQYKGNFNRITGNLNTDRGIITSAKLGQAAELGSLINLAKKGKIQSDGVIRGFNQLYKYSSKDKFDTPLPNSLLNQLRNRDSFLKNSKNIRLTRFRTIAQPRRGYDAFEESTTGAAIISGVSSKITGKMGLNGFGGAAARLWGNTKEAAQNLGNAFKTNDYGVIDPTWEAVKRGGEIGYNAGDMALRFGTFGILNLENPTAKAIKGGISKALDGVEGYVTRLVPEDYQPRNDEFFIDGGNPTTVWAANKEGIKELGKAILGVDNFDMSKASSMDIQKGLIRLSKEYGNDNPDIVGLDIEDQYRDLAELEEEVAQHNKERAEMWQQTAGHETVDRISNAASSGFNKAKDTVSNAFTGVKNVISGNETPSTYAPADVNIVKPSTTTTTATIDKSDQPSNKQPEKAPEPEDTKYKGYQELDLYKATKFCQLPKNWGYKPSQLVNRLFAESRGWCLRGVYQILKHGGLFPNGHPVSPGCPCANKYGPTLLATGWKNMNSSNFYRDAIPGDVVIFMGTEDHVYGHIQFKASDERWYSDFPQNNWNVYRYSKHAVTDEDYLRLSVLYRYCKVNNNGNIDYTDTTAEPEGDIAIDENNSLINGSNNSNNSSNNDGGLFGRISDAVDSTKSWAFDKIVNSGLFDLNGTHQIKDGETITKELISYGAYRNTPKTELKYLRPGLSRADWAREVKNQTGKSPSELIEGTSFNSLDVASGISFSKLRENNGFYEFSPISKDIVTDPTMAAVQAIKDSSETATNINIASSQEIIEGLNRVGDGIDRLNNTMAVTQSSNEGVAVPDEMTPSNSAVPAEAIQ